MIQMHFMPLKMTIRSKLLDMYANGKKNYQLASFQKGKYHHLVFPFKGIWGSFWKTIWDSGCVEWQIFPSVHSPRWLTQREYPAPMYPFHRVIRYSGQMGPQENSIPTSFSKLGQLWIPIMLLRALSIWILKSSKDEDGTMYPGNLLHCLAALMGKKSFSIYPVWDSLSLLSLTLPQCTTVKNLALSSWWPSHG